MNKLLINLFATPCSIPEVVQSAGFFSPHPLEDIFMMQYNKISYFLITVFRVIVEWWYEEL